MNTTQPACRGFSMTFDESLGVLIVELTVERLIDISLISDMEREIDQLTRELKPKVLIIDFANVAVFSSEVISLVLNVQRSLIHRQSLLKLTGLRPIVGQVFRLLNLDGTVVQIYESIDEAMADGPCEAIWPDSLCPSAPVSPRET